jgi:hypothetical protein
LDLGRAEEDNVRNTQEAMIISQTESSEQAASEMNPNLEKSSMAMHEHIHDSDEEVSLEEKKTDKKPKLVRVKQRKAV